MATRTESGADLAANKCKSQNALTLGRLLAAKQKCLKKQMLKKCLYCLARVVCNIDEQLYEECTMLYMYLLLYQMFITLYKVKLRFCDALLCIV